MAVTAETVTVESIQGTYTYETDLFAKAMQRTVADLWSEYVHMFGCDPRRDERSAGMRAAYRKLRKAEIAAIVAYAWTNRRMDERVADWDGSQVEFAAEVDALAADPLPDTARRVLEADLPVTETNVGVSDVAVVVQSGSKLIWGKLIAVVNRRTRYSAPFLCTVELESGVRQLVAADDVLAA